MIRIHPDIDLTLTCPKDNTALHISRVLIPGMHCLADATCPVCEESFFVELPVSHGMKSPVSANRATFEIVDPSGSVWLARSLFEGMVSPVQSSLAPSVKKFFHAERIVIVNCLDFLYGHSLLKLLNVQHYLEKTPELGCCVLTTPQLSHLVPDGVAEIWEFPIGQKDGGKWFTGLEKWIDEQIRKREEVFLSRAYSHPSSSRYDLNLFIRELPDISGEISSRSPVILFSYREDRLWGLTLDHQRENLQRVHDRLHAFFPDMAFVVVGFGEKPGIHSDSHSLIDLRSSRFDRELDKKWMAYMQASDCAIGVHGSNMLLPSGLAKATIELMPRSRLGNIFQDILFPHVLTDLRETLLRYRFLYGNDTLSDVTSGEVALLTASILANNRNSVSWFGMDENAPLLFRHDTDAVGLQAAQYLKAAGQAPADQQEEIRKRLERALIEGMHRLDIISGETEKL